MPLNGRSCGDRSSSSSGTHDWRATGANALEASFGNRPLTGDRVLLESLWDATAEALALYDGYGPGNDDLIALEMAGDLGQVHRALGYAKLLASAEAPVYLYHFSYVTEARRETDPAARHAAELPMCSTRWVRWRTSRIATASWLGR